MAAVPGILGLPVRDDAESIEVRLLNGWAQQGGTPPPRAYKTGGLVVLQGVLTGAGVIGSNNVAFDLPAGWRPALTVFNALIYYTSSWLTGSFVVGANNVPGRCALYNSANGFGTNMTNCGFNITYRAEA